MPQEATKERLKLLRAFAALERMEARLEAVERAAREPIAVVGLGCRFPGGAHDPRAFWHLLKEGVDAITEIPESRWSVEDFYDAEAAVAGKTCSRWCGALDDIDLFDAEFFGIAPREARSLDPQQRLLLEVAWEALEDAAQAPDRLAGSATGVFVGMSTFDYALRLLAGRGPAAIDAWSGTGGVLSPAAGRLSHFLGLTGPSMVVDTACSSSLLAVHLACQSLRSGESTLALAGGVNLLLSPALSINFSQARMLAPDGRCKTFDARADGYVRSEGCGVVVLKKLRDAEAAGDRILAVLRGSAVNHDGLSGGLTVPNGPAQQAVIRQALAQAGVAPQEVSYLEAHGTGTELGDPIEVGALAAVLGVERLPTSPLLLGSVKTNLGHLEAAAGIAGLIKVVLALQHGEIPPHLHHEEGNPLIPWSELAVEVVRERRPWPAAASRIAGISSFGFSGTNAHLVVEEAPAVSATVSVAVSVASPEVERPVHVLALSARSATALKRLRTRYGRYLAEEPGASLADICFSANTGRRHFRHRFAAVASSRAELAEQLAAEPRPLSGEAHGGVPQIAFLFPGQGAQTSGMGRELYSTHPAFRGRLDACDETFREHCGRALLPVLFEASASSALDRSLYAQPALFALELALAELWRSWGIEPSVVLGHDVGELVAACVAGVFSPEDGLVLAAERGRLLEAGEANGVVPADFAMAVRYGAPRKRLISGMSGREVDAAIATPEYWRRHLWGPARLSAAMGTLAEQDVEVLWLPSPGRDRLDWRQLFARLGSFYERGVAVDWTGFDRGYARRRVSLVTYPFERKRFWVEAGSSSFPGPTVSEHPEAEHPEANLVAMPHGGRRKFVFDYLRDAAGVALGLEPTHLDAARPLGQLGLDSLMAMELRNRIRADLAVELPLARFLDAANLEALTSELVARLPKNGNGTSAGEPVGAAEPRWNGAGGFEDVEGEL